MNNHLSESHVIHRLLSKLGKRIFFPAGIVVQAEQSKHARIQATAGMAFIEHSLASLPETQNIFPSLSPEQSIRYAPVAGLPTLRSAWLERMNKINPSLDTQYVSNPIVTAGLTHGVNTALHLVLDENDTLITPDCFWENYQHIGETVIGAQLSTFPMFNEKNKFNIAALSKILQTHLNQKKKAIILLNFPNNPTGYSICKDEAKNLFDVLHKYAEFGLSILTITDDAYFGLFYEEEVFQESLFSTLSQLHQNIFAVKIDGITKELLSWGLRVGFFTFGCKDLPEQITSMLEKKISAYIRSTITSASKLSQTIALQAIQTTTLEKSIQKHKNTLQKRFQTLKKSIQTASCSFPNAKITPAPCNSGYFISFICKSDSHSQQLRTTILEKEKIALISINNKLRFAFSCVEEYEIDSIIQIIYSYASLEL